MAKPPPKTFVPAIHPSIPWETRQHIQMLYQKLTNLNSAIGVVDGKIGATTTAVKTVIGSGGGGAGGGGGGGGTINVIGFVNDQTGQTAYTTAPGDYGALIVLSDASPIAVTLTGSTPPWFAFIANLGTGAATLTPDTSGGASTISYAGNPGVASMPLASGSWAVVAYDGINWWAATDAGTPTIVSSAGITIDGGASTPATGSKGYLSVPFNGTINSWVLLADQSGSAQITVKKSTYAGFPTTASIVASAPPLLSSQQKNESSTLTGWTTTITAGDVLEFNLDSVTTCQRLTLELKMTRS